MGKLKLILGPRTQGYVPPPDPGDLPLIAPPVQWDGTEGSGWTALGGEPTPNTLTATASQPVIFELQEPFLVYTEPGVLGLFVKSPFRAVASVKIKMEGAVATANGWSTRTVTDTRTGGTYTEWGYYFLLDTDSMVEGSFRWYGIAEDTAGEQAVLGPFVHHHFATEFDGTVQIAPSLSETSTRKQNLRNAVEASETLGYTRPNLQFIENVAVAEFANPTGDQNTAIKFWRTATCAPGVTVGIGNATLKAFRPQVNNMRWKGAGFTFDPKNMDDSYYCENTVAIWWMSFEGVTWENSDPLGREYLKNGAPPPGLIHEGGTDVISGHRCYFRDTLVQNVSQMFKYGRGWNNRVEHIAGDIWTSWHFAYNCYAEDADPAWHRDMLPEFSLGYVGPGTATVDMTGGNLAAHTMTLNINGSTYGPLTISNSVGGSNFWPSDWIASLNALGVSGLTVTDLNTGSRNNERRSTAMILTGNGYDDVEAVNIKDTTLTFGTSFDVHQDGAQYSSTGPRKSIGLMNMRFVGCDMIQFLFLTAPLGHTNFAFGNWECEGPINNYNVHLGGNQGTPPVKNLSLDHIVVPNNDIELDYATWTDCRLRGVIGFKFFQEIGTLTNCEGVGNYCQNQGATTPPSAGLVGTLGDFDPATDFVDFDNGDYTPTPGSAFALIPMDPAKDLPFDILNNPRNAMTSPTAREI